MAGRRLNRVANVSKKLGDIHATAALEEMRGRLSAVTSAGLWEEAAAARGAGDRIALTHLPIASLYARAELAVASNDLVGAYLLSTEAQRRSDGGDAVAKSIAKKIQAAMVGAEPPGRAEATALLRQVCEQQLRAEILIHRAAGRDATALRYRLGHLLGPHSDLAMIDAPPMTIPEPPPLVPEMNTDLVQEPPPPPVAA